MIDEHNSATRLELIMGKLNFDNYEHITNHIPVRVSISPDTNWNKIRHTPAAAQVFRVPARLFNCAPADNINHCHVFSNGKKVFSEEMPLLRAVRYRENTWEDEMDYVWNDGTRITSLRNDKPVYGSDGTITGTSCVCEDITVRDTIYNRIKVREKELRNRIMERTEQLSRARKKNEEEITRHPDPGVCLTMDQEAAAKVFQYSPDSISISTMEEGRYIQVNQAYTVLSGYENDELIGCTGKELGIWVYPAERDVMLQYIQKQGQITNFEMHFGTKSGKIRVCLVSGGTIDIHGEVQLICILKDITQRKQVEEKLCISEERFSKAFKFSPYPMCISTLDDGRFVEANECFCRATGFSSAELIGMNVFEVGIWMNAEERNLVRDMVIKNGSLRDFETPFRTRSGEYRAFIFNAEKIEVQNVPCIFSVIMDITEKKKIEAEMLRLERLNLVGEMATNIGHEIRNPMTTVRGYLQLLAENEKYRTEIEYFDLMIEELDKANLVITEFVSLAKNKLVELKPANINNVINQVMPLIQAKTLLRNQQIKAELENLPDMLMDAKEIRQLLMNLIENGIDSMPSGGKITIKTYMEKGHQVLAIKDEGHGIKAQDISKLGTPFFTTKDKGTGLGLAVCYRIAAHHNAKIQFDTNPSGTTCYIKFPLR